MKQTCIAILGMAALAPVSFAQSTDWLSTRQVDPLTDQVRHMAFTHGEDRIAAFICELDDGLRAFRVNNRLLDMEIGDQRTVRWRVDRRASVEGRWYNVDDGGALAAGREAIEIAQAIATASERLIVRSGGVTARYSVRGSTAAINEVFQACGIDPAP